MDSVCSERHLHTTLNMQTAAKTTQVNYASDVVSIARNSRVLRVQQPVFSMKIGKRGSGGSVDFGRQMDQAFRTQNTTCLTDAVQRIVEL